MQKDFKAQYCIYCLSIFPHIRNLISSHCTTLKMSIFEWWWLVAFTLPLTWFILHPLPVYLILPHSQCSPIFTLHFYGHDVCTQSLRLAKNCNLIYFSCRKQMQVCLFHYQIASLIDITLRLSCVWPMHAGFWVGRWVGRGCLFFFNQWNKFSNGNSNVS